MMLFNKYYKKFRKHRKDDIRDIVRSEILTQLYKIRAFENERLLISGYENNIVVSLTSHGSRLRNLYLVLDSISRQTLKPGRVVLWLSKDQFDDKNLPETLKPYVNELGLTVEYVKDLGPHTKLFYSLKNYPKDLIITIDDDIIYPQDLVETLYSSYLEHPGSICCNAAKVIEINDQGILPYIKWEKVTNRKMLQKNLLPLGVNGVLYFPNCFNHEVFNTEVFTKLCPKADDIWFRMMSYLNDIDIHLTGVYDEFLQDFIPIDVVNGESLATTNVLSGGNDEQLRAIINYYGLKFSY
jgi:hypothetical protein